MSSLDASLSRTGAPERRHRSRAARRPQRGFSSGPVATLLVGVLLLAASARADDMSVRRYDVLDGLPANRVSCIHQDAKGYLWIATWDGLARFDGESFEVYDASDGLASFLVNTVAEDRDGRLWVGTQGGGIARFLDDPRERDEARATGSTLFQNYAVGPTRESNQVNQILFDARGDVWCGTDGGIFRARLRVPGELAFEPVLTESYVARNGVGLIDRAGRIWFGVAGELCELGGARIARHVLPDSGLAADGEPSADGGRALDVMSLVEDREGRIVVAARRSILRFDPSTASHRDTSIEPPREGASSVESPGSGDSRIASPGDGDSSSGSPSDGHSSFERLPVELAADAVPIATLLDSKGAVWIGTTRGLVRIERDGTIARDAPGGLSDEWVTALCEDRDQNVWVGTRSAGISKLASNGVTTLTAADGVPERDVSRLVESRGGRVYAIVSGGSVYEIRDDRAFPVRGADRPEFQGISIRVLQDRAGDWWIGTNRALHRFRGDELDLSGGERFGPSDGLPDSGVFGAIAEDADGRIWFATNDNQICWSTPRPFDVPRFEHVHVAAFLDIDTPREIFFDRSGALWLVPYRGLARVRGRMGAPDARYDAFDASPDGEFDGRELFQDQRGWLWIAERFHGVSMTRDPDADRPAFARWSTRDGLASDAVWSIADDLRGRLYFATSKGVDRLDPESGRLAHYSVFDGLAGNLVNQVMRDRAGRIWAATSSGVSRIDPEHERAEPARADVYLTRVQLAGEDLPLPARGARDAGEMSLSSARNNLAFEYAGLSFHGEHALRYRYMLEGADQGWSEPTAHRAVHFANLASGDYRFLVRVDEPDRAPSSPPAEFRFHIPPPVWMQPWFVGSAIACACAAGYALHRARVRRLVALEHVRSQIATDIHDDLGSGLAEIAILSEVAKRGERDRESHLDRIAALSRSMRESMGDIVWAVDPRKDHFADLIQRMRQVAFNLLEAEGVRVEFAAPDSERVASAAIAPDRRRHLFLLFKEVVTNVARHAEASHVHVHLAIDAGTLELRIEDDGRGFDASTVHAGQGLKNLRRRAELYGGTLELSSTPGRGTRVVFRATS